jgi:hypothetical protein
MTHPLITAFGYVHEVIDTQRTTADLGDDASEGCSLSRHDGNARRNLVSGGSQ